MSFKIKSSTLTFLALFLLAFSCATTHAFDITQLLGQHPEFSAFNKFLTDNQLAQQINSRNTLTVLAVDSSAISAIAGKSQEDLKAILSTHVILDYYDEKKLVAAAGTKELLTTLYQTTGLAVNNQGFIKVAIVGEGEVAFGSAVNGAAMDSKLVKTVITQPYNISILQISKPIIFPGAGGNAPTPSQGGKGPVPPQGGGTVPAATPGQGAKAPGSGSTSPVPNSPAPAQGGKTPVSPISGQVPTSSPTPAEKAPVPSHDGKTPVPGQGPVPSQNASSPAPAQGGNTPVSPSGKAPISGQGPMPSPGGKAPTPLSVPPSGQGAGSSPPGQGAGSPDAAAPVSPGGNAASPGSGQPPAAGHADGAADAPAPTHPSSSSHTKVGLFGAVIGFASLLVAL